MNTQPERYALLSVYDKRGIIEFAQTLNNVGIKIISTGGTAQELIKHKIPVIPISEITGEPESFDGRMKTISFQIESGILFDRSIPSHVDQAKLLGIKPIDVVVCNLYPFETKNTIENIDVGGPTMIRAAAKNFQHVLIVIDPADYKDIGEALTHNVITKTMRQKLAAKAFEHTSFYDSLISQFFNKELFPEEITLPLRKSQDLRYGENPHQKAALYLYPNISSPLKNLTKKWGRDLSLINVSDINAGIEVVKLFHEPAAVVIKHNSPCGIALGNSISQALERAIKADPQSAFGGVIVLNKTIDIKSAHVIGKFKSETRGNVDIFTAPNIDQSALHFLMQVRKNMGIYTFGNIHSSKQMNIKWVNGGLILQTADEDIEESFKNWRVVTKIKPSKKQLEQMKIAWKFISRIRSNSIIVVDKRIPMIRGIGSGQTSRIAATHIALQQALKYTKGSILASDSFFPFNDSVKLAAKYGVGAIIQQGGSIRDADSITAADNAHIPMVFTGRRAFWH
ncbi:MAG: bifunctional phosphoribosylaminoimidazolecarboxamide formyltransferase/IMP cyclohydrolase [bacterium]